MTRLRHFLPPQENDLREIVRRARLAGEAGLRPDVAGFFEFCARQVLPGPHEEAA